jgi:DNA-binding transcriptional LysR family regulator
VNLSNIDLNLLLVLHTLLQDPSVARAAKRLNVTSSAVSNSLAKLRDLLGDPLFVRRGRGIVPTPGALALAPALQTAMKHIDTALSSTQQIDPRKTTRTLTIALADSEQVSALPAIVSSCAKEMPRANLRVISVDTLIAHGGLEAGAADVAIGPHNPDEDLLSHPLYTEEAVLVVRKGHPLLRKKDRLNLDALRHIDIHIALGRGGRGHEQAEAEFERMGGRRDIAVKVPSFAAAAMVAAKTDYVTGLPKRLFAALGRSASLIAVGGGMHFDMRLLWHERTDMDPICQRLRSLIIERIQQMNHC